MPPETVSETKDESFWNRVHKIESAFHLGLEKHEPKETAGALLELDRDEIVLSWEEFQALLNQTGRKYVPPVQMKEEKVVLTRGQFKRLLQHMKAPVVTTVTPPADYLITEAAYKGKLGKKNIHRARVSNG